MNRRSMLKLLALSSLAPLALTASPAFDPDKRHVDITRDGVTLRNRPLREVRKGDALLVVGPADDSLVGDRFVAAEDAKFDGAAFRWMWSVVVL